MVGGDILQNSLCHFEANLEYKFYISCPNAKMIFDKATTKPCPLGNTLNSRQCLEANKTKRILQT
jgi:hypothetical protein